jgi:predicted O-methyltransferase YrrM
MKHLIHSAFAAAGFRLIRWPRGGASAAVVRAGPPPEFFPTGVVRPWTIPADLRALAEGGVKWAAELVELYQHNAAWPASIAPEAGMLLQALVRNIAPTRIVETGTCLGASTIWMASGLELLGGHGLVHTFDDFREVTDQRLALSPLFHDRRRGVEERFARAGLAHRIRVHQGDSKSLIVAEHPQLKDPVEPGCPRGVQLAFIDGDHSAAGALADLLAVEPVLPAGGYVLLHDVFPALSNHDGPRFVIDHLSTHAAGQYQVCDVYTAQTNYGLTLLRRTG